MLMGIDILQNLIEVAEKKVPGVVFNVLDISSDSFATDGEYDYVCLMGVLQIFDKPDTPIKNLLSIVKPGGMALVAGPFNKEPVSLITRYFDYSKLDENQPPDAELAGIFFVLSKCGDALNA